MSKYLFTYVDTDSQFGRSLGWSDGRPEKKWVRIKSHSSSKKTSRALQLYTNISNLSKCNLNLKSALLFYCLLQLKENFNLIAAISLL